MYVLPGGVFVSAGIECFLNFVVEKFMEILGFDVLVEGGGSKGYSQGDLYRIVHFKVVSAVHIEPRNVVASCIVGEDVVSSRPFVGIVPKAGSLVRLCSPGLGLVAEVVPKVVVEAGAQGVYVVGVSVEVNRYEGGSFGVSLKLNEPISDEVVSLLCDCITM